MKTEGKSYQDSKYHHYHQVDSGNGYFVDMVRGMLRRRVDCAYANLSEVKNMMDVREPSKKVHYWGRSAHEGMEKQKWVWQWRELPMCEHRVYDVLCR